MSFGRPTIYNIDIGDIILNRISKDHVKSSDKSLRKYFFRIRVD